MYSAFILGNASGHLSSCELDDFWQLFFIYLFPKQLTLEVFYMQVRVKGLL